MFVVEIIVAIIIAFFYNRSAAKRSFRRVLAGELGEWLAEGLISSEQSEKIRGRYRLERLEEESQAILLKTLFMFGALLIALGVVAFVAAHWETIPKIGKLGLVTLAMLGAHVGGYLFWKGKHPSPYLGHALIILGSLIFGANIALMAQIFHIPGDYYQGFLLWSIGAVAVGYAVGSVPHLLLAMVASLIWFAFSMGEFGDETPLYLLLLPTIILPYTYRNTSRGTHFLLEMVWAIAVMFFLIPFRGQHSGFWLISGAAAVALIFWGYADLPWVRKTEDFSDDSKIWSVLILGILSYSLSFHGIVEDVAASHLSWPSLWRSVVVLVLWGGAVAMTIYGYIRSQVRDRRLAYAIIVLSGLICIMVGFLQGDWAVIAGIIAVNGIVLLLGSYLFWKGLSELDRRYFWLGMALLIAEVLGRFFEYDTGLLWKSAAFILAGVALIYGGILFEKRRGRVTEDAA